MDNNININDEKFVDMELPQGDLKTDVSRAEFGLKLKMWRLRNMLTQVQAGNKFHCSRNTIMRVEAGKHVSWQSAYRLFSLLADELAAERLRRTEKK